MAFNFPCNFKRTHRGERRPPHKSFTKVLAEKTVPAEEAVAARRKKMRSLLDIDWNASTRGLSPAAAVASDSASARGVNRVGFAGKVLEDGKERKRRLWEALLDAAAIAVIREYEGNLGREDMEYRAENRIRSPGKSGVVVNSWSGRDRWPDIGGACAYDVEAAAAAVPVTRSKRGRVVALPNRYKDTILGAEEEEFP